MSPPDLPEGQGHPASQGRAPGSSSGPRATDGPRGAEEPRGPSARARERLFAAAREADEPPERVDKYELVRELGRGGMGIVYEARDVVLGRRVALKLLGSAAGLDEQARQRFVREARAAAGLAHPGIAAVYDASPEYIALQYVDGTPLSELVPAEPAFAASWIAEAARAVDAAHRAGIVHRDLKPSNVMVERDRDGRTGAGARVVVLDFGLAKMTAVDSSLSTSGNLLGTPAFMSPEQAAGRTADERSDVYGLGATLFALLTGEPPFPETDLMRLLKDIAERDAPGLRAAGVDRDLETVCQRCLAKEPERRYRSAAALADDLDRWAAGDAVEARPPSLGYRLGKFARRRRAVLRVVVSAALVVATMLTFALIERSVRIGQERALELAGRTATLIADAEQHRRSLEFEQAERRLLGGIAAWEEFLTEYDLAYAHYQLGRLLTQLGRDERARVELERALTADPTLTPARFERGLLTMRAIADLEGAQRFPDYLAVDPTPVGKEERTDELVRLREEARSDLELALSDPDAFERRDVLFAEAFLLELSGDASGAEAKLGALLTLDRNHQRARLALIRLALDRGDMATSRSLAAQLADEVRLGSGGLAHAAAIANVARTPPSAQKSLDDQVESDPAGQPPWYYQPEKRLRLPGLVGVWLRAGPNDVLPSDAALYERRALARVREAARSQTPDGARLEALDLALRDMNAVLELDPNAFAGLNNRSVVQAARALAFAALGEPGRAASAGGAALADLQALLALEAELPIALENLARLRLAGIGPAVQPGVERGELERARAGLVPGSDLLHAIDERLAQL